MTILIQGEVCISTVLTSHSCLAQPMGRPAVVEQAAGLDAIGDSADPHGSADAEAGKNGYQVQLCQRGVM